jgi:hypothetical protein
MKFVAFSTQKKREGNFSFPSVNFPLFPLGGIKKKKLI